MRVSASLSFAIFLTPLCVLAAGNTNSLSLQPAILEENVPLFQRVATSNSAVLSRLYFQGYYFPECISGKKIGTLILQCVEVEGKFGTPRVQLLKDRKNYALYENVSDGAFSLDKRFLALRNATVIGKDRVIEQVRIITIASKVFKRLPLVSCTNNILRWSQNKLITSSDVLETNNGGEVQTHLEICIWDSDAKLLGKIESRDTATGTTERPISRMGFLPSEQSVFYSLSGNGRQPGGACKLTALDTRDPSRTATITFDPQASENYNCADGAPDTIELDLSTFTIASPTLHFRVHHTVNSSVNQTSVGPWKTVQ